MSVLVTGANGFLASHIVDQLLDAGHRVRGSVRSGKEDSLRSAYASYGDRFDATVIDDIGTSDLEPAFRDGTRRMLHAARAANVKKVVVTSSLAALFVNAEEDKQEDITVDENSWNPLTVEDVLRPGADAVVVYGVSKKLSEQLTWQFASENPDIDVSTVIPPWCIGPISPHSYNPAEAMKTYSNRVIYDMINGFEGRPWQEYVERHKDYIPIFVHISDIARAHVLAVESAPSPMIKRIVVSGGQLYLSDAARHIAKVRPQLKDRLPVVGESFRDIRTHVKVDASSAGKILGMGPYKSWQETVEETVDNILSVQERK
ncbi:hypothetical protein EWM64_g5384 [Hericium alpestre]|uniref:NAD-dependent epimerase/dehydratase domain-containing protein n=1 Tax=Hericium alpestre TaxID=135208 RepID=A0A4Y9ZWR6_9AGAM|nr:hypothetical protein EWM64_g5384 [Hericium alpestre]